MKNKMYTIGAASFLLSVLSLYAQIPNYRVSHPGSSTPNEVTIAVNPSDPDNLAAGANLYFYYYSRDGGKTWTEGRLETYLGVWGDPCVCFDQEGNLYYAHLSNPAGGYWIDRIVVQKSVNGGEDWNAGVGVGFNYPRNQDKEWISADITQSPFRGSLYMAWTEFDSYGSPSPDHRSRIRFSRSMDAGDQWDQAVTVSDRQGNCLDGDYTTEGAVPAVGPDGEVYLAWAFDEKIWFDRSLDGGVTWGQDIEAADQPGGWNFNVSGMQRCNGLPVTVCDISDSPFRGTVYILFADQRNGYSDTDVWVVKSSDKGETWTEPLRVNDDPPGRHQFFPWIAVDPETGFLYVVFYDRRETPGDDTDVYLAESHDGGETWRNFKISESSFTPNTAVFMGDYNDIDAYSGMVHPIWGRLDYGSLRSVWTAVYVDSIATSVSENTFPEPAGYMLERNYPNPFNSRTCIEFSISSPEHVTVLLYNTLGQEIRILTDRSYAAGRHGVFLEAEDLPSGIYFYRIQAGKYSEVRKCLLLR